MIGQPFLAEFGRHLREARVRAGLSVTELAARARLSRRHLTEAEAGRANLSLTKLADLARALELSPAVLVDVRSWPNKSGRIALVGLRGAGKSSVGRALALALEVPFVELDRRVEGLAGLPLASIFDLHGAAGFRRLEAEALECVLAEGDALVIATSGSVVLSPKTFARLCATCRTVWLAATPAVHWQRVAAQGDRRPIEGRPQAFAELERTLAERESAYARCEVRIDTTRQAAEEIAAELARRFSA